MNLKNKIALKNVVFIILLIFIAVLILTAFPEYKLYPDSSQSQEQLEQIKKEKEQTRKKIEQAQEEQEKYASQVEEVEGKLLSALSDLKDLNDSMAAAKLQSDKTALLLVSNENEISLLEKELNEKTDILNSRIADAYKNDDRNILNILLKTGDFIEFVSRIKIMNILVKQDAEILAEVKEKKARLLEVNKNILDLKKQQNEDKKEIEELIHLSEEKNREIEDIYNEKLELFSQAKANKDALIAMENQLTAKENEITNILQDYNYGNAPSGKLLWPANGKLSSKFGPRTNKYTGRTRMHNGIDLYAPLGTPVIAADSGQVLKAEYHGGYGYAILVYHGGGVATYYAHLSGFAVNIGQYVQKGQIIGYVGNTGYTTGYHLHFEVRINGTAHDPANYL